MRPRRRAQSRLLLAASGVAVGALLSLLAVAALRFAAADPAPAKNTNIAAEPRSR